MWNCLCTIIDNVPVVTICKVSVGSRCSDACRLFKGIAAKKQTGQLEIGDLDLTGAISSIKEGDTQVNFNGDESDSDKVDTLLNYLLNSRKGELVCYRKIRW